MEQVLFGQRLRKARESAEMSQEELARHLGVKLSTVVKWEAGDVDPRANRLQMIASLLNVPLLWLMAGGQTVPDYTGQAESNELVLKKIDEITLKMRELERELQDLRVVAEQLGS